MPRAGIPFALHLAVLDLDELAPRTPQLPHWRWGVLVQLAASTALHATLVVGVASLIRAAPAPDRASFHPRPTAEQPPGPLVFVAPALPQPGRGGGGGGNRQPGPIRRAQGVGSDPVTLRTRKTPPPSAPVTAPATVGMEEEAPPLPAIFLDAKPLASGLFDQLGLPTGAVLSGTSLGPGSGGGVGTGVGTGIGSGRGPGLGPGYGGGTGGGAYRPGGAVSVPRLTEHVKPRYTSEALERKIQGPVVLEAIVTSNGRTSRIRVVGSLDPGGLDEQAVAAVAQWRFEPGRLAGTAVDVIVTIRLDFAIH